MNEQDLQDTLVQQGLEDVAHERAEGARRDIDEAGADLPGTITLYRFDDKTPPSPVAPPWPLEETSVDMPLTYEKLASALMRGQRLEAALTKALSIIQFSLANLDGNTKGWPEDDIRELGNAVSAELGLSPLTREVGAALRIWAAPVLTGPTVERKPKVERKKRTMNSPPRHDKVRRVGAKRKPSLKTSHTTKPSSRRGKPNPKAKRRPKAKT